MKNVKEMVCQNIYVKLTHVTFQGYIFLLLNLTSYNLISEKLSWHTTPGPRECTQYVAIPRKPGALLKQIDKVREPWRWDPIKSRIRQTWKFWRQAAEDFYGWADNLEMKQVFLISAYYKDVIFIDEYCHSEVCFENNINFESKECA